MNLLRHSFFLHLASATLAAVAGSAPAFCGGDGDLTKIKALLKDNPDLVFSKDNDPDGDGDLANVRALLKSNPDLVLSKDNSGDTALYYAAAAGYKDVAALLLANGADVNARDNAGQTPLHVAAYRGHNNVVRVLLANKADVNARDNRGETPLHSAAAAAAGHPEDVAESLLANKADVNAKRNDGETPLYEAADWANTGVAKVLLANKADVNAKSNDGSTPLHEAASICPCRGDTVVDTDGAGRITGFHGFVGNSRSRGEDMAELLLANKADVNAKDNKGRTALYWAAKAGHADIVTLLRQHGGRK
jgi:ankyrin repeat protein